MKITKLLVSITTAVVTLVLTGSLLFGSALANRNPVPSISASYSSGVVSPLNHTRNMTRVKIRLAETHDEICLENEQQCLRGCDGAEQCSNQCGANYQGCMDQGE